MDTPDITCVIPVYNDRVNLGRAVASALGQKAVRVEVLLVDDCSDAATREYVATLGDTDPRIRTFFLQRNGGQGQARNIGAMLAAGRFIAFLDQDDEHSPGWYREALEYLEQRPSLGALTGDATVIDIPVRFGIDRTDLRIRGLSSVFVTNIVFRRSVFLASGGFPTTGLWRSAIAGEDGTYRVGLARNWNFVRCAREALIHRAREGGATVYFLDRSKVEQDKVVMTRLEEIESNGQLESAQQDFWDRARLCAQEVGACRAATSSL
jgi:glycosyltransferase involved in cell wall biosynthesis